MHFYVFDKKHLIFQSNSISQQLEKMAFDFNGPSFQKSSEVFCHHRKFISDGAADTDTNKQYIATTQADLSVSFIRILTSEICMVAKKSLQPPNMQSRRNFRRTREKIGTNIVHFEKNSFNTNVQIYSLQAMVNNY